MGEPARGYTWPDFEEGNQAARRHGAHSGDLAERAEEIAEEIRRDSPWTAAPAFARDLHACAWAEAQCERYRTHYAEHDLFDGKGAPREGLERWARAEAAARSARANLGLNPQSMAKLLTRLSSIDGPAAKHGLDGLKDLGRGIREAADRRALEAAASEGAT